jgi:hypothetical protein
LLKTATLAAGARRRGQVVNRWFFHDLAPLTTTLAVVLGCSLKQRDCGRRVEAANGAMIARRVLGRDRAGEDHFELAMRVAAHEIVATALRAECADSHAGGVRS